MNPREGEGESEGGEGGEGGEGEASLAPTRGVGRAGVGACPYAGSTGSLAATTGWPSTS